MKNGLLFLLVLPTIFADAQHRENAVGTVKPSGQTALHHPVMIRQAYFLRSCWDISSFSSKDMQNRKIQNPVLNADYNFDGKYYSIYHGYDTKDKGKPKLVIDQLQWDNDVWPKAVTN